MPTRHDVSNVPLQGGYVAKQCPVRAQNDAIHPGEPLPASAFKQRLFRGGNEFEASVFAELIARHPDAVVVDKDARFAEAQAETLAAMQCNAPLILGGWLPSDEVHRRVGKPDILVRAGGGGYRAIDVKNHQNLEPARGTKSEFPGRCATLTAPAFESSTVDPDYAAKKKEGDLLQLAHYQRMLAALGMAASDGRWAGIVGVEKSVVWYDLDAPLKRTPSITAGTKVRSAMERYDFEFDFRLDVIAVAQQHQADPSIELLTVPVKIGECPDCPWWGYCGPKLEAPPGDVSLLPWIGWKAWKFHHDRGVTNRAELAAIDIATDADRFAGMSLTTLQEQIDQARAAVGEAPAYRRRGITAVAVPRADIEVDVDMENVETGCYLWGTFVTVNSAPVSREFTVHHKVSTDAGETPATLTDLFKPGYRAFVSWEPMTPQVEAANSLEFWRYLTSLRTRAHAAGLSFRAYCWNENAENTYLRRLGQSADIEADVEAFIASDEWVDLLKIWDSQLITGHGSGLKLIAPIAGTHWHAGDAGGSQSMVMYDLAVGGGPGTAAAHEWLLEYNSDDVGATLAIREWLSSALIPSVADVVLS